MDIFFIYFSPGKPTKSRFPRLGGLGLRSTNGPRTSNFKIRIWESLPMVEWTRNRLVARVVLTFPHVYHLGVKLLKISLIAFPYTGQKFGSFFLRLFELKLSTFSWGVTDKYLCIVWEILSFTQYLSTQISSLTTIGWSHWNLYPLNVTGSVFFTYDSWACVFGL